MPSVDKPLHVFLAVLILTLAAPWEVSGEQNSAIVSSRDQILNMLSGNKEQPDATGSSGSPRTRAMTESKNSGKCHSKVNSKCNPVGPSEIAVELLPAGGDTRMNFKNHFSRCAFVSLFLGLVGCATHSTQEDKSIGVPQSSNGAFSSASIPGEKSDLDRTGESVAAAIQDKISALTILSVSETCWKYLFQPSKKCALELFGSPATAPCHYPSSAKCRPLG